MDISKEDAKEIVSQISILLGTKMNIMNSEGIIIASTNQNRIGTFHKAAYDIIKNNLHDYEISSENKVEGTQPGQNLPIYVEDEIIGVVGITGNSEETRKYISIVQKMTEILILGKIRESKYQIKQNRINSYLFDWVYNEDKTKRAYLISKGLELGIDITLKRRLIILRVDDNSNHIEKRIFNFLRLQDSTNLVFASSDYIIAAIKEDTEENLHQLLNSLKEKIVNKDSTINLGCSGQWEKRTLVRKQYLQALKAYTVSKNNKEASIVFYNDLGIELILNNLNYEIKTEITNKVFFNLEDKAIREYVTILKAFYKANGSLKVASSYLNIHVNTIQYHLNKLKDKTGYDARNYKDSILIQMAINFIEEF
ncbi:MAG: helix-turn-helix domain-containing protein [Spirochaetaceae bacterium]|nr:helix-turn-helix domain-containing protein [Spirochaetaceae bacterium]